MEDRLPRSVAVEGSRGLTAEAQRNAKKRKIYCFPTLSAFSAPLRFKWFHHDDDAELCFVQRLGIMRREIEKDVKKEREDDAFVR
jgi:hypothetical protein